VLSRREALGALGAATLAAGCAPIAARVRPKAAASDFALPKTDVDPGVRLFARAGFGHRPGDLKDYAERGHRATVERLLRADEADDPALTMQILRLEVFRTNALDQSDLLTEREAMGQLQRAAILRAVYGPNPLQERLADFWTNHFCIYGRKGQAKFRLGSDTSEVIRKNALGKFPDMLRASAHSPAMLGFLDAEANRKGSPNENYARELLELHTLGVNGGYTQRDIQEIARCFTGWTLEDRFLRRRGTFRFDPDRHDPGAKEVLGHRIPAGGGKEDGDRVLDIVASHPSTARYLAEKLCLAFVGERSSSLEERLAEDYRKTGGEIRTMMRTLLVSDEFRDGPPILKRPLDLVAGALRALDGTTDGGAGIHAHLAAMGQPLYEWPMPDGYPTDTQTWAGAMLPRWNFAFALGAGTIEGTSLSLASLGTPALFGAIFGRQPGKDDGDLLAAMAEKGSAAGVALALAAPANQWR
jgi:uncharacterized protein (DUF1800 family)